MIALCSILILAVAIVAIIKFTGFANKPDGSTDTMELSEVSGYVLEKGYTQDQIEEKLKGEFRNDIIASWGEPDGMLSGFWGDMWYLDDKDDMRITLYYDNEGYVMGVRIISTVEENKLIYGETDTDDIPLDKEDMVIEQVGVLTEPPEMTVVCNGKQITALRGTYSWEYQNEDGTSTAIEADSMHPLDAQEYMPDLPLAYSYQSSVSAFRAYLQFAVAPDEIDVVYWSTDCWGNASADKKGKKSKKPKKKREKKEKPRKVEEIITKPEKKLPRKRVLSTLALCFSILAAVLILQNVVFKTDNLKEAKYAFDNGDYATCFANLGAVERTEEEEELYQKSMIIMSVQRKWDAYNNYLALGNRMEALNSLLEGVIKYRGQEDLALEYGVHAQITVIYQDILEALQGFGLSQADVDEILAYESKVTYTKRLDSIVNGTPFVIEDSSQSTTISEPQPLQDVLPGEEDFLPEDTTLINEPSAITELPEAKPAEVQDTQSSGETVVVGSSPVDVSSQNNDVSYEEPVVTGGQNVGTGSTNISSEVTGQNVLIGVR